MFHDITGFDTFPNESMSQFYQRMSDSLFVRLNAEIVSSEAISYLSVEGREYLVKNKFQEMEYFRLRMFRAENKLFVLMAGSMKEQLYNADIDYFLNSFKWDKINRDWKIFSYKEGAFSALMPGTPEYKLNETPDPLGISSEPYKIHLHLANDKEKIYLIRYSDYPTGIIVVDDSLTYLDVTNILKSKLGDKATYKTKKIKNHGYEGQELSYIL